MLKELFEFDPEINAEVLNNEGETFVIESTKSIHDLVSKWVDKGYNLRRIIYCLHTVINRIEIEEMDLQATKISCYRKIAEKDPAKMN